MRIIAVRPGGKSGLHGNRVPGNARRGSGSARAANLRESATESRPPRPFLRSSGPREGRVEGTWRGKGERVRQERTAPPATGAAWQAPPGARPNRDGTPGLPHVFIRMTRSRAGRVSGPAVRVGRARRMATCVPDEWPSPARARAGGQNPAYRLAGWKRGFPQEPREAPPSISVTLTQCQRAAGHGAAQWAISSVAIRGA